MITYNKSSAMTQGYHSGFHDDLKGMNTLGILFSCDKFYNETYYNRWNFSTPVLWDDFWFNAQDNSILHRTERFIVGKQSIEVAPIRLQPVIETYID